MKKVVFIIGLLLCFGISYSQTIQWVDKDGPWRPAITDISIGENLFVPNQKGIYVATFYGLFKSTDGVNWNRLFSESASAVECLKYEPNIVYVAKGGGMYKSTDGGANFFAIDNGINNFIIKRIAISPFDQNLLAIGCQTGNECFYITQNGGLNWNPVDFNGIQFTNPNVTDIKFSSKYDGVMFIASADNEFCNGGIGIFKSTDFGLSWKLKNNGLGGCQAYALGIEPLSVPGENIFTYVTWNTGYGIYKSEDEAENWTFVQNIVNVTDFDVKGENIYASINSICESFTFEPAGIIKSTDHGATWNYFANGIGSLSGNAICSEVGNDNLWVGGYWGGFYKSTDYGNNFSEVTLRNEQLDISTLYASDNFIIAGPYNSTRFSITTNDGATWLSYLQNCYVDNITYDIEGDNGLNNLYSTQYVYGNDLGFVIKSTNSGIDWFTVYSTKDFEPNINAHLRDIDIDPISQNNIYMCGNRTFEVRRSTDYGQSWLESLSLNTNFYSGYFSIAVDKFSFSQGQCKDIYVGGVTSDGSHFQISYNAGALFSWQSFDEGYTGTTVYTISISEKVNGVYYIYAGTSNGMWRRQLGEPKETYNWQQINNGLTHTDINSVVAHPLYPNVVIAGCRDIATNFGHIYVSTNFGNLWIEQSSGFPQIFLRKLKFSKNNTSFPRLFAATESGVYEGLLQGDKINFSNFESKTFNYPNPFNPVTKIYFRLNSDSKVSIRIYDILGREVNKVLDSFLKKGEQVIEFNGSELASGIYFYQIYTENENFKPRKIVLIK